MSLQMEVMLEDCSNSTPQKQKAQFDKEKFGKDLLFDTVKLDWVFNSKFVKPQSFSKRTSESDKIDITNANNIKAK